MQIFQNKSKKNEEILSTEMLEGFYFVVINQPVLIATVAN